MAKTGRPPHFTTPEEFEKKWNEYTEKCLKNNDWITKGHFCTTYGYYADLFHEYKKKAEFSSLYARITHDCQYHLLNRGLKNLHNPNIVRLIASAHHGITEKQNVDQTNTNIEMTYSEYAKKIEEEETKAREKKK